MSNNGKEGNKGMAPRRALPLFCLVFLLGLTACVTNHDVPLSEILGPKEAAGGFAAKGMLVVYSETEDINDGGILYHPHTGYGIFTPEHKRVRSKDIPKP
jgi:hypothetical protein